jgi:hypothetical protein
MNLMITAHQNDFHHKPVIFAFTGAGTVTLLAAGSWAHETLALRAIQMHLERHSS